jgi:hypothetical protein
MASDRREAEGIILGVIAGGPLWALFFWLIYCFLEWLK